MEYWSDGKFASSIANNDDDLHGYLRYGHLCWNRHEDDYGRQHDCCSNHSRYIGDDLRWRIGDFNRDWLRRDSSLEYWSDGQYAYVISFGYDLLHGNVSSRSLRKSGICTNDDNCFSKGNPNDNIK